MKIPSTVCLILFVLFKSNAANYSFENSFENLNNEIAELFSESDCLFKDNFEELNVLAHETCRWTNIQQVDPANALNEITIEDALVFDGDNSLRLLARATDSISSFSKMDIEKGGLYFSIGAHVTIEAYFYIATNANIENLLLLDLESCSVWDPTVGDYDPNEPENQCPGVRLIMKNNDHLSIERGKIGGSTLTQSTVAFPRFQWVNVKWEMVLSPNRDDEVNPQYADGLNKLYINNQEVIAYSGMNMPNAVLFQAIFAENGIEFELQEPIYYERFQIGVTANPTQNDIEIYIDKVKINSVDSDFYLFDSGSN